MHLLLTYYYTESPPPDAPQSDAPGLKFYIGVGLALALLFPL